MTIKLLVGFLCILIPCCTSFRPDAMLGPGRWLVIHVEKCENDEQYQFRFEINRRKVNRTHDGFSGWLDLDKELDKSYGVFIDVCKHVDGGCKPYNVLTDDSFCHFIDKYAKENAEKLFVQAGLPLPVCPVPLGRHEVKDFVFDYGELPDNGIYGLFVAKMFLLEAERKVACVALTVKFDKGDGED